MTRAALLRHGIAAGKLVSPAGLTVTPHGTIYVSDNGKSGTDGRVVRIG